MDGMDIERKRVIEILEATLHGFYQREQGAASAALHSTGTVAERFEARVEAYSYCVQDLERVIDAIRHPRDE